MKLENRFRTKMCEALQALRGAKLYIQKNHGSQFSSGLPDLELQDYDWGKVWVELKAVEKGNFSWTQQPTALQFSTLQKIAVAGGNARVCIWHAEFKLVVCFPFHMVKIWKEEGMVHGEEVFRRYGMPFKALTVFEGEARNMFWGATNP